MSMLELALQTKLPLIHISTDDPLNLEEVLQYVAGDQLKVGKLDLSNASGPSFQLPKGNSVFYTSSKVDNWVKIYRTCEDAEVSIVFVNIPASGRSSLMFDGGVLTPPQGLVKKKLTEMFGDADAAEALLPAFGGLNLKDVVEVAKLTMTRDGSITARGINETRRSYESGLDGVEAIDTQLDFYICPDELKMWLNENASFFLHPPHPALMPRGLLMDGPPGTGKTLAAKHIAATFGVPLYRLDLGSMMGRYVGESETNLLKALQQLDQVEPCVALFDESEKVFGHHGGDSGVASRMESQMLWWLQESKSRVFKVMTTNDVSRIPPELHREGRIDRTMQFTGINNNVDGVLFGRQAYVTMAEKIGVQVSATDLIKVEKAIKLLFIDSAVPQAKITQAVFTVLKQVSQKEKSE